ncbi:MAG: hypothetical protein ACKV2O_18415 [Acidimicrobiales bacterium]
MRTMLIVGLLVGSMVACGGGDGADGEVTAAAASSPIAELLGFSADPADQGAQQQRYMEQEREVQDAIAACMAEEGFDYTPVDPSTFMGPVGAVEDLPYDSREFAEKYGLGMSTRFEENFTVPSPADMPVDPNQAMIEGLSESQREAYYKALHGEQPQFDPTETPDSMMAWEPSGCDGDARKNIDKSQGFYQEFGEQMGEIYERIENDPELVAAEKKWATCMADKGFEYENPQAMHEEASTKMNALMGMQEATMATTMVASAESDGESVETGVTIVPGGGMGSPPEVDPEQLAEMQAWETKVAVANWDCSKDLNKLRQTVQARYEQEFIDANRDKIDAILRNNSNNSNNSNSGK